MLNEILGEAAASDPGIEIIDDRQCPDGPLCRAAADVVLSASTNPHNWAVARALLFESFAPRVVLVTPTGTEAVIYDLSCRPLCAVDLSASDLLKVACDGSTPHAT